MSSGQWLGSLSAVFDVDVLLALHELLGHLTSSPPNRVRHTKANTFYPPLIAPTKLAKVNLASRPRCRFPGLLYAFVTAHDRQTNQMARQ
jgi:hypothetical protein